MEYAGPVRKGEDAGRPLPGGSFLLRVTVDGHAENQIVHITR